MFKIATQGQPASFHHQAVSHLFAQPHQIISCATFPEVFEALRKKEAQAGVVAVENSLYGGLNEIYDLLLHDHAWISGEHYIPITQNLITLPGVRLEDIRDVYSHTVALPQCSIFLDKKLPHAERHIHEDTAGAVADIKKWGDPSKAAIASAFAAEHYGLPILVPHIENDRHNYTRFIALSPTPQPHPEATKTSLMLDARHAPGALYHALGTFAEQKINLTMLTSRPIVGDPGHYRFYIDVAVGEQTEAFQTAYNRITNEGYLLTILGSYQAAPLPWAS